MSVGRVCVCVHMCVCVCVYVWIHTSVLIKSRGSCEGELTLPLSDTLSQCHNSHQVLRVVDENECVAMEMEEEADLLSQQ